MSKEDYKKYHIYYYVIMMIFLILNGFYCLKISQYLLFAFACFFALLDIIGVICLFTDPELRKKE